MAWLAVAVTAGLFDLKWRRIPNWLALAGLVLGFVLHLSQAGPAGVGTAAAGAGLALAVYLPLWLLRAMGGGDLKLMAALGAILGWQEWLLLFVAASLGGAVIAIGVVLCRGRLGRTLANVGSILVDLTRFRAPYRRNPELDIGHERAVTLPHGTVIALASILLAAAGVTP